MEKKKALAILYSPKTLVDFTWYYYTYGEKFEWDVMIIACDNDIKIKGECEKSGLFNNIYCENINYDKISRLKQGVIFLEMFFSWIFRKKKIFVKKHFKKKGIELKYSQHLIYSNYASLDSGLLQCFADEVPTIILEDGMSDYISRTYRFDKNGNKNIDSLIAYIMCKLNYASLNQPDAGTSYVTKNSKLCDKYSVHPDKMKYREYRTINKLGDTTYTDIIEYNKCLKRMYSIEKLDDYSGDVILYTTPISDFDDKNQLTIINKTIEYICTHYCPKRVLMKKHPRDNGKYIFPEDVQVIEIPPNIPAELVVNIVNVKKHIYMFTSTVIMSCVDYKNVDVICYKGLLNNSTSYKSSFSNSIEALQIAKSQVKIVS